MIAQFTDWRSAAASCLLREVAVFLAPSALPAAPIRFLDNYQPIFFAFRPAGSIYRGEKFVNESMPANQPNKGGGVIDVVRNITELNLVRAIKIGVDATGEPMAAPMR